MDLFRHTQLDSPSLTGFPKKISMITLKITSLTQVDLAKLKGVDSTIFLKRKFSDNYCLRAIKIESTFLFIVMEIKPLIISLKQLNGFDPMKILRVNRDL